MSRPVFSADPDAAFGLLGVVGSFGGLVTSQNLTGKGLVVKNRAGNLFGFSGKEGVNGQFLVCDLPQIPSDGSDVTASLLDAFPYTAGATPYAIDLSSVPLRGATGLVILFSTNSSPFTFTPAVSPALFISAKAK